MSAPKGLSLFLSLCLLLALPNRAQSELIQPRALFVSVIEDPAVLSSREEIIKLIGFAQKAHIQILFIQIYRANKAWFPSKIADATPYEAAFKTVGEDPLRFLLRKAHAAGIQVHAWVNLLSLSVNEEAPILKKYGPSILTRNLEEKKVLGDYKIDNQYFLEPGDLRVRRALLKIVEEILKKYQSLDGIQFDYLRYPDRHPFYGYTEMNIRRFKKATGQVKVEEGSKAWNDWKRSQVTGLLELLVVQARKLRPHLQISTTGCAPYVRAYAEAFQDWPSWLNADLVDFVTVMTYPPIVSEFERSIEGVKAKTNDFRKVYIGIGAYKLVNSSEVFAQELGVCERSGARGCAIFHYGSLLKNTALQSSLIRPLDDEWGSPQEPEAGEDRGIKII